MKVGRYGKFNPTALACNLKRLREGRGLSIDDMADIAGVCSGTVRHIETGYRGESVTLRVVLLMAQALGVTLDELVGGTVGNTGAWDLVPLPARQSAGSIARWFERLSAELAEDGLVVVLGAGLEPSRIVHLETGIVVRKLAWGASTIWWDQSIQFVEKDGVEITYDFLRPD